ncbi:MAG: hypothetical protein DRG40_00205 [Deltaproteobacteria bacterium]|nr:MAG: hypothetical protein DRG40_00205 [Deltaproteobacteria bacterium]
MIGIFLAVGGAFAQQVGFTQEDRERLIRLEATLKTFMEQVDKRFSDLRSDMNKRFEQVDKRFEQVDRRFEQVTNFLWMLVAIFTALTAANIGFAYWDRRTIIRKARDEAIERIEREGRLVDLIGALRELAKEDRKLAEILRGFRLM